MKRLLLCLPGLVLAVSAGSASTSARADPPLELAGTGERLSLAFVPPFSANGNMTRFGLAVTGELSGDLVSTAPLAESLRCKLLESGRTKCEGESLLTETIDGVGKGITRSEITASCDATGSCDTRYRIEGIDGDLTRLRGTGTSHVSPTGDITYEILLTRV